MTRSYSIPVDSEASQAIFHQCCFRVCIALSARWMVVVPLVDTSSRYPSRVVRPPRIPIRYGRNGGERSWSVCLERLMIDLEIDMTASTYSYAFGSLRL